MTSMSTPLMRIALAARVIVSSSGWSCAISIIPRCENMML
jgi:hypothetical protein